MKGLLTLFLFLSPYAVFAQQPAEAKTYQSYPYGLQMVQAGYMRQTTNTTVDNAVTFPSNNINVGVDIYYLRYVNFFKIGNTGGGLQVVLPFANINADFLGVPAQNSGIGDAVVAIGTAILGSSPPLTFSAFARKPKKELALAWAVLFTIPTGKYSTDVLLNPGANRWQIKPELGLSVPVGKWDLEANASLRFFTKNPELPSIIPGQPSASLTQKPMPGLTTHVVYNFSPHFWVSFDMAGRFGGETSRSGINENDAQQLFALGGAAAYTVGLRHIFGASYITNAAGNAYAPNGSIFSIKYSFMFGRDLNRVSRMMREMKAGVTQ